MCSLILIINVDVKRLKAEDQGREPGKKTVCLT